MYCSRCRSTSLKHTNGAIVCRECGYEKKGVQIADDDNEFVPGAFGRHVRKVGYVTEKQHTDQAKGQEVDVDLLKLPKNERLMRYLEWFQDVMLKAAEMFASDVGCEENLQQAVKQLWLQYLKNWMGLRIPLPAFFSLVNNQQQGWKTDEILQSDFQESADSEEQNAAVEENELVEQKSNSSDGEPVEDASDKEQAEAGDQQIDIEQSFDLTYGKKVHFDISKPNPDSVIMSDLESATQVQSKIAPTSAPEKHPPTFSQMVGQLMRKLQLDSVQTFFSKLTKLPDWKPRQLNTVSRSYCKKMFALENPQEMISYNRVKMLQLRKMAVRRNFGEVMFREKGITRLLFCYDLLLNTCPNEQPEGTPIADLYEMHLTGKQTRPLVRLALKVVKQFATGSPKKSKSQKKMPFLSFKLIYSLIHVACLTKGQPLFISEIIQRTKINPTREPWLNLKFMNVGRSPSEIRVRRTSIRLCEFLQLRLPMMAGKWIDRFLSDFDLRSEAHYISHLYKTLVNNDIPTICSEEVLVLAIILIHFKLAIGLDNEPHLATMDIEEIRSRYHMANNLKSIKISCFKQKINELSRSRQMTRLRFGDILQKIKRANAKSEHPVCLNSIQNLEHLDANGLTEIIEELEKQIIASSSNPDKLEEKYRNLTGLFTSIPTKQRASPSPIQVIDLTTPSHLSYNFKATVYNQLPWKVKSITKSDEAALKRGLNAVLDSDVPLPCHSYETIVNFKSVYRCLPRDELFIVMEGLAQGRCNIDSLWTTLERLERNLMVYENEDD